MQLMRLTGPAIVLAVVAPVPVLAQAGPPVGWSGLVDGLAVYQGDTDLDEGGSFSARRSFLRSGALYRWESGTSAGLAVSVGRFDYTFDSATPAPWGDINTIQLAAPLRFGLGGSASVFLAPSLRYDYEQGASASDGETWGAFGGVTWRLSDRLTIGPAFGAFSQIGADDLQIFPALLVDWDITDRWNLRTGTGLGATQGPGLTLSYAYSDALSLSLTARSEDVRFRLDNEGLAPGGVGEDSSYPVVVGLDYQPAPNLSLQAFAGAEFGGELSLEDRSGAVVSTQDYDTAPLAGIALRLAF
jgi:hypothetical protein